MRQIPSVERILREVDPGGLPRPIVLRIVRSGLASLRETLLRDGAQAPAESEILQHIDQHIDAAIALASRSRLRPVINATGIVIHTNLGRSPLAREAVDALAAVSGGYSNLEFDLNRGSRGRRGEYVDLALAVACEAEAAAVVNNCAAALVLVLHHFTNRRKAEVVISRGELVQIGGGFRVPEILKASGAKLREVGTTNRTTLRDYEQALTEKTALILKVHRSNFYMDGFVESVPLEQLSAVAKQRGVLLVEDLGSGALWKTETVGAGHEPTPAEALAAGADLVSFSGDKLMGGPQAGVIAGAAKHIEALKGDPMFRALRCDKLVLAALQTTLELHLSQREGEIPIIAMMRAPPQKLRTRAHAIIAALELGAAAHIGIVETTAQVGGGSMPRCALPSIALEITAPGSPEALAKGLRHAEPPIIGYIHGDRVRLDLRSVLPDQDEALACGVRAALAEAGG